MFEENVNAIVQKQIIGKKTITRVIDAMSGEIISVTHTEQKQGEPQNRSKLKQAYFYKLYATNWQDIVKKKRLTFTEIGLFMSLVAFLDWESQFLIDPYTGKNLSCSKIATILSTDRAHVSEIMDRLCDKGLISKVMRGSGCSCHFMLNSNVVHFGKYMKDLRHVEVFKDCKYNAPTDVKYSQPPSKKTDTK